MNELVNPVQESQVAETMGIIAASLDRLLATMVILEESLVVVLVPAPPDEDSREIERGIEREIDRPASPLLRDLIRHQLVIEGIQKYLDNIKDRVDV
jgi:hypothetical protein